MNAPLSSRNPKSSLDRLARGCGIVLLLAQLGLIAYSRTVSERFFCWAPYDQHSHYEVRVTAGGKELTPREISRRYRYKSGGWEQRSIHNLFSIIRQYETTYGRADGAEIVVRYSTNGRPEEEWRWPPR